MRAHALALCAAATIGWAQALENGGPRYLPDPPTTHSWQNLAVF